jgi:hypothetical protein
VSRISAELDGLRDPEYRGVAARYLGKAGYAEAITRIQLLLDAADPKARLGAVRALAALRSVESFERSANLRDQNRITTSGWAVFSMHPDYGPRRDWSPYGVRR